jgi:prepilin-type N-terminal cleavage/methylation domain-containing protein
MRPARLHKKGFIHRLVSKRLRGFSLIELLVVIGILGIIIAVVLTSLNVQRNYQKARDTVRESDVNQIQKALTQYYIDHRCLPLQSLWDNLNCNSEVPDELKPYFSKIPCDPETGEKYYVEFQDKNCQRCNGGCGVCIGLRVLASLNLPKGKGGGVAAGCDEDRGCGVYKPNGDKYNYGIGSNNYCVVPTPTAMSTPAQSPTPTNTLAPIPTPTNTPPIEQQVGIACPGNLLPNGSMELDANHDLWPDLWLTWGTPNANEGVQCSGGSDGLCSFVQRPDGSHQLRIKYGYIDSNIHADSVTAPAGTAFTYSFDAKSTANGGSVTSKAGIQLILSHADGTTDQSNFYINTEVPGSRLPNTWYHGELTTSATKPVTNIYVSGMGTDPIGPAFYGDNFCLKKESNPVPTPSLIPTPTFTPTPTPRQPELWIGAYWTTERFRLDGTRIATVSGSFGHMDSSKFVTLVGNEIWAIKYLQAPYPIPVIRRYTKDGVLAGPDLTNAEMVDVGALTQVGNQVWMGNRSNQYYGNKGTISRINLDGSIAASAVIADPISPEDILLVGQEVWLINKMIPSIWRFNRDGTQIGSTLYYNDAPNYQNPAKPRYLRSSAVVGDKVWVPMYINSVTKIMRLNLDGSVYGSYIDVPGGSTYAADDIVVVGNEVWVLFRSDHDAIGRYDVNGNFLGIIPVDIEYAEFMYLVP